MTGETERARFFAVSEKGGQSREFFARLKKGGRKTRRFGRKKAAAEHDTTKPLIELKQLSKRFGIDEDTATDALVEVDLTIQAGEFIAIMGPSGCGKTTLLNLIGLLDRPTSGEYFLNQQDVAKLSEGRKNRLRGREIGFIFQNFNLISRMNVIENVALPLTYQRGAHFRHLQRASKMLETFDLCNREYFYPNQLSGGQSQRVAIARALINRPSIILADEPTGNLDSKNSEIIMDELQRIHREGNTILMVTHNPDLLSFATRVIHMKDGQIAKDIELVAAKPKTSRFVSTRQRMRREK